VIIFEIAHQQFEMPSEEQAMKAFEVFKGAKPLDYVRGDKPKNVRFQRTDDHPQISVSMVPDDQLLENNEEKKLSGGEE
jgi:hypothetical protein